MSVAQATVTQKVSFAPVMPKYGCPFPMVKIPYEDCGNGFATARRAYVFVVLASVSTQRSGEQSYKVANRLWLRNPPLDDVFQPWRKCRRVPFAVVSMWPTPFSFSKISPSRAAKKLPTLLVDHHTGYREDIVVCDTSTRAAQWHARRRPRARI